MRHFIAAVAIALGLFSTPATAQTYPDTVTRIKNALALVWEVAMNPTVLFKHIDYSETREMRTDEGRFQAIYRDARRKLNPERELDEDTFAPLRGKFADPSVVRTTYDLSRQMGLETVTKVAVKGTVINLLNAGMPILGKPLTLNAASAGEWFGVACYEPEKDQRDAAWCKKTNFAKLFKEDYGVEATRSNVYVLSWLYRRHLEGGPKLVAEWQRIGLDLAKVYEITQVIEVGAPQR